MDPHTRQIQQHIEFEMRSWSYAFGLTMELVPLHVHIVKGFRESLGDYTGPEQKEVAMSLLKPAAEALGAWFRQCLVLEGAAACYQTFTDPEDGVLFATFKYDVSRQPISFQIPLHRFLTSCWAESIRWSEGQVELGPDLGAACGLYLPGTTELDAVATEQDCFPLALLEYPLRILIALAQNQAGMWVRNGLAIPGQQYAYIGPSLCEAMYETDITSVQLACCALGADAFVRILKKRFNVSKWLGGGPLTEGTETPEQAITILEEFIYVIILTLSERGALDDEGNEGIMKRRIIHRLAVGSQSHSALIRALPRSVADAKNFDQVLLEVGEYRRPDATQTGMFDLKAGLMEGVDPFSCYLSRKEREIVRELKRSKVGSPLCALPRCFLPDLTKQSFFSVATCFLSSGSCHRACQAWSPSSSRPFFGMCSSASSMLPSQTCRILGIPPSP
jgi:E3 ubiquitin-protein ligase UBR1